jgi:haloalkane dehalogenase
MWSATLEPSVAWGEIVSGSVVHMTNDKQYAVVLGARMAYVDVGAGIPIVLQHGNPTSSYLWRDVIAELSDRYRCIAPDLIGMGDSEKVGGEYRFVDHRRYLDSLLDSLDLGDEVVLVGHDWGGALLFDWANRHRGSVKGIAYMETLVSPLTWDDWPDDARRIFQAMRSDAGEEIVLEKNVFVERILPASVLGSLSEETMAEYRRPFAAPGEDRRPTLTWPRQIPIDGTPEDVNELMQSYADWLATSSVPKLFVNAEPGSILTGRQREVCRTWPNQTEVTVRGSHFIQEDSGSEIGRAIANWLGSM